MTDSRSWLRKYRFAAGGLATLTATLFLIVAIFLNLRAMEKNRIQEYRTLANKIVDFSVDFILLKQYENLLNVMQALTKTSHIQYMALYVDGERRIQAVDASDLELSVQDMLESVKRVTPMIQKPRYLYLNQYLPNNAHLANAQIVLQFAFSFKEFQERQKAIVLAMAVIAFLLVVLSLLQAQLHKQETTKSEMIRAISHHSMQFISAIYAKIYNLLDQKGGSVPVQALKKDLRIIRENVDALKRSLENLKDNEWLNKGRVKSLPRKMDLRPIIQVAVQSFEESLDKRGMQIKLPTLPDVLDIWADPEIVKPILMNLLDNAVKFSRPESQLEIRVETGPDCIQVLVLDKGPGIAPENQRKIFRPFVRLDSKVQGSGLGLSNSRQLARLLGGELGIRESRPGLGSTFYLRLSTDLPAEDQVQRSRI